MKYFVTIHAPADKGEEIDRAGGPGPVVAALSARFTIDCMYGTPTKRSLYFVCELADATDIAVLMEIAASKLFAYPQLEPVIAGRDLPGFVREVHARLERQP